MEHRVGGEWGPWQSCPLGGVLFEGAEYRAGDEKEIFPLADRLATVLGWT